MTRQKNVLNNSLTLLTTLTNSMTPSTISPILSSLLSPISSTSSSSYNTNTFLTTKLPKEPPPNKQTKKHHRKLSFLYKQVEHLELKLLFKRAFIERELLCKLELAKKIKDDASELELNSLIQLNQIRSKIIFKSKKVTINDNNVDVDDNNDRKIQQQKQRNNNIINNNNVSSSKKSIKSFKTNSCPSIKNSTNKNKNSYNKNSSNKDSSNKDSKDSINKNSFNKNSSNNNDNSLSNKNNNFDDNNLGKKNGSNQENKSRLSSSNNNNNDNNSSDQIDICFDDLSIDELTNLLDQKEKEMNSAIQSSQNQIEELLKDAYDYLEEEEYLKLDIQDIKLEIDDLETMCI